MRLIKIIILLFVMSPFMFLLSGCYNDSFLSAIHEEEDFIEPFDVVVSTEESKRTTYFAIPDTGRVDVYQNGDDASFNDISSEIDLDPKLNVQRPAAAGGIPEINTDDDVVEDKVTGFTWTRCSATGVNAMSTDDNCSLPVNSSMSWTEAVATCDSLNTKYANPDGLANTGDEIGYAGYNDWRLPRLPELLSILNYNHYPAIDPVIFPGNEGAINKGYWTYTSRTFLSQYDDIVNNGWVVYFGGGDVFGFGINITEIKRKVSDTGVVTLQFVRCVRGGLKKL